METHGDFMRTMAKYTEREGEPMSKHTPGPWRIERGGGHQRPSICGSEDIHTNGFERNELGISSASYSSRVCEIHGDLELMGPMANAMLLSAAPLLLAACQFKAYTGMEDDLLYYIAEHLLSESRAIQEGFEKGGGNEDSPRLAAMYRRWADMLFAKQKLQAAAIEAALGPVPDLPGARENR